MKSKSLKWKNILIVSIVLFAAIILTKNYLENEWSKFKVETGNKTNKTIIRKAAFDIMANNTYMIVSESGRVVVMDPYDVIPGPTPDLITVSHLHGDHYDEEYVASMNCRKSIAKAETIDLNGIKMISLASSHEGDPINYSNPSNVIYSIELDSLKIVHLGDYGQAKLTDDQKAILKGVDILIMPTAYNPITESSINNIIDELHPSIIFTTHSDNKRLTALKKRITEEEVTTELYRVNKAEIDKNAIKLITLERDKKGLLFAHYLVYKFTGSILFKMILVLLVLIIAVWIYFRKRRKKKNSIKK